MAHVHFVLALGYLFWDIRRSSFGGRGWQYLLVFCLIMFSWNIVAFVGHVAAGYIKADAIAQTNGYLSSRILGPLTLSKFLYYLTRFDHLIEVPGLFFLYLGVKSLYRSVGEKEGGTGK